MDLIDSPTRGCRLVEGDHRIVSSEPVEFYIEARTLESTPMLKGKGISGPLTIRCTKYVVRGGRKFAPLKYCP